MTRVAAAPAFGLLAAIVVAAFALAIGVGSVSLDPAAVLRALLGAGDATSRGIVVELRLPRATAAFATGGSLALAGAILQVLLRNPLADPYVLGVSGGAATGALLTMLLGAAAWATPVGAFAGALVSAALLFALARGAGAWSPIRLLLTGVILASGWGALVLTLAPETQLRGMLFWLIGDLSSAPAAWAPLKAGGSGKRPAGHRLPRCARKRTRVAVASARRPVSGLVSLDRLPSHSQLRTVASKRSTLTYRCGAAPE